MNNIPLVTSSAEASSNPISDVVIFVIFTFIGIGILWLFLRKRNKRDRK